MEKLNFVTLEAAMVRDWLNMQIENYDMQKASYKFSDSVQLISPPDDGIHMYCGIVYITELLGLDMEEKARDDTLYPWEYSFVYAGDQVLPNVGRKAWKVCRCSRRMKI